MQIKTRKLFTKILYNHGVLDIRCKYFSEVKSTQTSYLRIGLQNRLLILVLKYLDLRSYQKCV